MQPGSPGTRPTSPRTSTSVWLKAWVQAIHRTPAQWLALRIGDTQVSALISREKNTPLRLKPWAATEILVG